MDWVLRLVPSRYAARLVQHIIDSVHKVQPYRSFAQDIRHLPLIYRIHTSRSRPQPQIPIKRNQHRLAHFRLFHPTQSLPTEHQRPIRKVVQLPSGHIEDLVIHRLAVLVRFGEMRRFRPKAQVGQVRPLGRLDTEDHGARAEIGFEVRDGQDGFEPERRGFPSETVQLSEDRQGDDDCPSPGFDEARHEREGGEEDVGVKDEGGIAL